MLGGNESHRDENRKVLCRLVSPLEKVVGRILGATRMRDRSELGHARSNFSQAVLTIVEGQSVTRAAERLV